MIKNMSTFIFALLIHAHIIGSNLGIEEDIASERTIAFFGGDDDAVLGNNVSVRSDKSGILG